MSLHHVNFWLCRVQYQQYGIIVTNSLRSITNTPMQMVCICLQQLIYGYTESNFKKKEVAYMWSISVYLQTKLYVHTVFNNI